MVTLYLILCVVTIPDIINKQAEQMREASRAKGHNKRQKEEPSLEEGRSLALETEPPLAQNIRG
jgi:hypothetical protein